MKTVLITKDDVLTAIETEPVLGCRFFYDDATCATCAVGAVLRQAGVKTSYLSRAGQRVTEKRSSAYITAKEGNWLSALSVTWETLNKKNKKASPEDLRWNIWEWADENIPEDWEYELVVQGGVA